MLCYLPITKDYFGWYRKTVQKLKLYIYFSFVPSVRVQANPKFNNLKSFLEQGRIFKSKTKAISKQYPKCLPTSCSVNYYYY